MKAVPSRVRSTAPSPRTASEMRKAGSSVGWSAVGWNWMNSMLAMRAPARYAMAMPSPVAIAGLVVWRYTCPHPPAASIVKRERTDHDRPGPVVQHQGARCTPAGPPGPA